jgi:hypothetical protein
MSSRRPCRAPLFKTVSREGKIKEWSSVLQDMVRHYSGTAIGDAEAADYADQFWRSLESRSTPIMDITATPGTKAAEWALATFKASLVAANLERTE